METLHKEQEPSLTGYDSNQWVPDEEFRNSLATVTQDGKRIWLFPKQSLGKWTNYRKYVAWFLIGLWVAGPWMQWDGQPLMLFNVLERHFIILGNHFYPQDLAYFGVLLLTFFLFIAVFTLTYGRVWCGWACPQTLFMEHVYRQIEYWVEGSPKQQKALKEGPWNAEKIGKRALKHGIFITITLAIGNLVLLYVLGKQEVFNWYSEGIFSNMRNFAFLAGFSTVFYLVFSWAREQVCTAMCPYGRLQSVLLNNSSLTVIYNHLRGEPRSALKRNKKDNSILVSGGDCIDCGLCVQVCPTGIDIRNGTQLECINCTACMDACDNVMVKIGKPEGLITLNNHKNIDGNKGVWKPTRKTWLATAAMILLLGADALILANRKPVNITILRVPGQLYQLKENNRISNLYNLQLVNKTNEPMHFKAEVADAKIQVLAGTMDVPAQGYTDLTLFVEFSRDKVHTRKNDIEVIFTDGEGRQFVKKTAFLAP